MGVKRNKLQLVQSFRAVAILIVMLGHANHMFYKKFHYDWFHIGQWLRMGGVDFFFVVTGFMIYYLYGSKAGSFTAAKQFFVRRWVRVYPLYFLFTLGALSMLFLFSMQGEGHKRDLFVILKSFLLLPVDPILTVTWSLQYIMLFYLLFSGFLACPKIVKPILLGWTVVLISVQLRWLPGKETFLLHFSNLEILAGCFVAYVIQRYTVRRGMVLILVGLAGYLFVWMNNVIHAVSIEVPHFYFLFSVIMMLGITATDLRKRVKVPSFLSFLGDASYSIYIAHGPFIQFYLILFHTLNIQQAIGNLMALLLLLVLTVGSCLLVYLMIERPLIREVKRLMSRGPLTKKKRRKELYPTNPLIHERR